MTPCADRPRGPGACDAITTAVTVDKQANGTEAGLGRVTEDAAGDERLGPVGMPIPVTAVDLRLLPAANGWRSLERATSTRVFGCGPGGTSQASLPGERVHLRVGVGRRHREHRQPVLDIITDGEIS